MNRLEELTQNLAEINLRIETACRDFGRNFNEVKLISVTKTWPASDIRLLHKLGLKDFGESRDQEAMQKVEELSDLDARWHFIGQVQSNKLNHIAKYADVVHALDREKVVTGLDAAAAKAGRRITGLLQISLDGDESRGGVAIDSALALAEVFSGCSNLDFGGVMAVAPLDGDADVAFAALHTISTKIQVRFPQATMISAGMSQDLEIALKNGATHLRIGSALLGKRE
jgi:pyridoxal phosphate enzyme (YggS family)